MNDRDFKQDVKFITAIVLLTLALIFVILTGCTTGKEVQGRLYACRVKEWIIIDRSYWHDTVMVIERIDRHDTFLIYRNDAGNVLYPVGTLIPLAILSTFKKEL